MSALRLGCVIRRSGESMSSESDRSRTVFAAVIVAVLLLSGLVAYTQISRPGVRASAGSSTPTPATPRPNPQSSAELAAVTAQLATATSVRTDTRADVTVSSIGPSLAGSWSVQGDTDVSANGGLYRVTATGFDAADLETIGLSGLGLTPADLAQGVEVLSTSTATYVRTAAESWQRTPETDNPLTDNLGSLTGYAALVNGCRPTASTPQTDGGLQITCTLVVTPAVAQALGLSADAGEQLASRSDRTDIVMNIRTDSQGSLQSLQVNAEVDTFGLSAQFRTFVDFTDWNQPVIVPTPPPN